MKKLSSGVAKRKLKGWWASVCVFFFRWAHTSGLYRKKTDIYRWLWERKFKNSPVQTYDSVTDLAHALQGKQWKADDWRSLWDAVSYAGKVQNNLDTSAPLGDCDDFAIYTVTAINNSLKVGRLQGSTRLGISVALPGYFNLTAISKTAKAELILCVWLDGWKPNGHALALLTMEDGTQAIMDYGYPVKINSLKDAHRTVCLNYARSADCTPLGVAVLAQDLRPITLLT